MAFTDLISTTSHTPAAIVAGYKERSDKRASCACAAMSAEICFPKAPRVGMPTPPTPDALGEGSQKIAAHALILHFANALQRQRQDLENKIGNSAPGQAASLRQRLEKVVYLESSMLALLNLAANREVKPSELVCLNHLLSHQEEETAHIENEYKPHEAAILMGAAPQLYTQSPIWLQLDFTEKFLTRRMGHIKQAVVDTADLAGGMQDFALAVSLAAAATPKTEAEAEKLKIDVLTEVKKEVIESGKTATAEAVSEETVKRAFNVMEEMRALHEHTKSAAQVYGEMVGTKAKQFFARTRAMFARTPEEEKAAEAALATPAAATPEEIIAQTNNLTTALGEAGAKFSPLLGLIRETAEQAQGNSSLESLKEWGRGLHGRIKPAFTSFAEGLGDMQAHCQSQLDAIKGAKEAIKKGWEKGNEGLFTMSGGLPVSLMQQVYTPEQTEKLMQESNDWLKSQLPATAFSATLGGVFKNLAQSDVFNSKDGPSISGNAYKA